jgi:predicted hydrocarbon binding protein
MNEKNDLRLEVELFSTSEGLQVINSPCKVKILSLLRKGDLSFDEIVSLSGRAKSTISGHLKELAEQNIIRSEPDPKDARKKIFSIKSHYLGRLHHKDMQEDLKRYIKRYIDNENDPFEFFRLIFHTIRVSLISQGIDVDPILHEAGTSVGEVLFEQIKDPELNIFLQNIAVFWKTHNLGEVEVVSTEPLTIKVGDCFECSGLPQLNRPACAFDSGILETLFSNYFKTHSSVQEVDCHAMGSDHCSFVIKNQS